MVRDGVVEGVGEGFSSESTAVVFPCSFRFLSLLFSILDAERARHLLVLAGFRSFSLHHVHGSALRRGSSSCLRSLLIQLVSPTSAPGSSHLQGIRQATSRGLGNLLHASSACSSRSRGSFFTFTFSRR